MIRCKAVFQKKSFIVCLFILLAPTLAGAFNYRQPAYISSFYLCNKLINKNNTLQPEKVLNALLADNPKESATIVIEFVGNKGVHNPEVEILDMNGQPYSDIIKLNSVTIKEDGGFFRVTPRVSGKFPQGGIYFKISDTHDTGSRTMLGMFGVMTIK